MVALTELHTFGLIVNAMILMVVVALLAVLIFLYLSRQ